MLRNCVRCGRLFTHERSHLCLECSLQNKHGSRSIRDETIRAGAPKAPGPAPSQKTAPIDAARTVAYLRNRRAAKGKQPVKRPICLHCGVEIPLGRYCRDCREALNNNETTRRISGGYRRHRGAYRAARSK